MITVEWQNKPSIPCFKEPYRHRLSLVPVALLVIHHSEEAIYIARYKSWSRIRSASSYFLCASLMSLASFMTSSFLSLSLSAFDSLNVSNLAGWDNLYFNASFTSRFYLYKIYYQAFLPNIRVYLRGTHRLPR